MRRCPSFTLCTYLSPSPSPYLHPSTVQGSALFSKRQKHKTTPGRKKEAKKEERARTVAFKWCKILKQAQGTKEEWAHIAKNKKGAIRSFCLVTFIVSPVLMAEKPPPTRRLLRSPPTTTTTTPCSQAGPLSDKKQINALGNVHMHAHLSPESHKPITRRQRSNH